MGWILCRPRREFWAKFCHLFVNVGDKEMRNGICTFSAAPLTHPDTRFNRVSANLRASPHREALLWRNAKVRAKLYGHSAPPNSIYSEASARLCVAMAWVPPKGDVLSWLKTGCLIGNGAAEDEDGNTKIKRRFATDYVGQRSIE